MHVRLYWVADVTLYGHKVPGLTVGWWVHGCVGEVSRVDAVVYTNLCTSRCRGDLQQQVFARHVTPCGES
jgi:hypothetical protein